ncbi:MAG TPA: alpha/beta fold hydrolase [Burkholderiaceae bacterium]|nr:alpha/beta fold hydrolase [Burkholderiaceae bacterium]HQR77242.1 alpha/beta fold hydrolase [Burkholderiaceae bacterium]
MTRSPTLSLRRWLAAIAVALIGLGTVAGCTSLDEWQRQAIFNPARDNPRWFAEPLDGTEEYDVRLANGDTLHFWYVPQKDSAGAPTVLYLHGARWNMNGSVFRIARWHDLGFNVLAVDYRGFGRSTEILPSEATAGEDTRAAFDELVRRQPDATRRYVYGHSLGGALAIDLASQLPADQLRGLIVEATFTSIPDLVKGMRWGWVPGIGLVVTQRFDSSARIEKVTVPLLILHGTADNVVPHTMADELYQRAGSRDKQVVKLEGATHSGMRGSASAYREAVLSFTQATATTAASSAAASATAVAD